MSYVAFRSGTLKTPRSGRALCGLCLDGPATHAHLMWKCEHFREARELMMHKAHEVAPHLCKEIDFMDDNEAMSYALGKGARTSGEKIWMIYQNVIMD